MLIRRLKYYKFSEIIYLTIYKIGYIISIEIEKLLINICKNRKNIKLDIQLSLPQYHNDFDLECLGSKKYDRDFLYSAVDYCL